jgi:hypothetical protein
MRARTHLVAAQVEGRVWEHGAHLPQQLLQHRVGLVVGGVERGALLTDPPRAAAVRRRDGRRAGRDDAWIPHAP